MIVVDTSALMAIYLGEPDAEHLGSVIFDAERALIGAPTLFEFRMVAANRRGVFAVPHAILDRPGIEIVAWDQRHAAVAQEAFVRFGKGQGHPAQLNFGDCMSYALAKVLDVPLLYKGNDFALTDIAAAV